MHVQLHEMLIIIFWDVTLCNPIEVRRSFGGTYCLHLQSRRVSQTSNQQETGKQLLVTSLAYLSTRKMEAVRSSETSDNFYQTTRCHFRNIVIFTVVALRTSNSLHVFVNTGYETNGHNSVLDKTWRIFLFAATFSKKEHEIVRLRWIIYLAGMEEKRETLRILIGKTLEKWVFVRRKK
jgi:hypothetical protein